jgi:hypothetical protein
MGVSVFGRCYTTASEGTDAYWSYIPGSFLQSGSFVSPVHTAGSWSIVTYDGAVPVSSVSAPAVSFSSCDPGQYAADGAALGAAVLICWALVWSVKVIRRAL